MNLSELLLYDCQPELEYVFVFHYDGMGADRKIEPYLLAFAVVVEDSDSVLLPEHVVSRRHYEFCVSILVVFHNFVLNEQSMKLLVLDYSNNYDFRQVLVNDTFVEYQGIETAVDVY